MAVSKKRIFLIILAVPLLAFIVIQFKRPDRTNPPIDATRTMEAHVTVTPQVAAIFERSCDDCHTHKTVWPFYSQIAPVSWLVADDVRIGRNHLNMSDWASYDAKKRSKKLREICDEVMDGAMPLSQYLIVHRSAKLSPEEVKLLCDWSDAEREKMEAAEEKKD
jgi:hypothetical protein